MVALLADLAITIFFRVACHLTCGTDETMKLKSIFCYLDSLGMTLEELPVVCALMHTHKV